MPLQPHEVKNWLIFGGISLLLTLGCVGLLLGPGLNMALDRAVQRLPASVEDKLGAQLLGQLVKAGASHDAEIGAILKKCGQALPLKGEERKFDVLLVEDAEINAFALPGGHLVLHRGLLDKLQDQHELMAVLGHEAGHVRKRHFLARLAHTASLGVVFAVLLGDTSGLVAVLADSGRELLARGYSRGEEQVADDEGLATLQRLGMDPHGMERVMQRLKDASEGGLAVPEFFSTHPDTEKRRLRMQAAAAALPAGSYELLSAQEWARLKRPATAAGK